VVAFVDEEFSFFSKLDGCSIVMRRAWLLACGIPLPLVIRPRRFQLPFKRPVFFLPNWCAFLSLSFLAVTLHFFFGLCGSTGGRIFFPTPF